MGFINSILSSIGLNSAQHVENNPNEENTVDNKQPDSNSEEKVTDIIDTTSISPSNEEDASKKTSTSGKKAKIFNLIIVDESGSMSGLRNVTLSGINETINTIREAQKEYGEVQEHFISLVTFDERNDRNTPAVRTIIDAAPASSVEDFSDYRPQGCTPLYDAMGDSLSKLRNKISGDEDATGVVTVLTDGLENASRKWRVDELRKLIEQLKEEGWTFSYMGSAHDVKEVTDLLSIDNVLEFCHDNMGASNTWGRERSSKRAYFSKMACEFDADESWEEKKARRRRYNQEYYGDRVTPNYISSLEPNEVFVFGSNPEGIHNGGAARAAVQKFGAQMGVGEGLQGHSYAIPSTDGMQMLAEAIHRFCIFAREHQNMKFLVTRIGCGIAGHSPREIAPLFRDVIELENVSLPADFWEVLGLRMFNL